MQFDQLSLLVGMFWLDVDIKRYEFLSSHSTRRYLLDSVYIQNSRKLSIKKCPLVTISFSKHFHSHPTIVSKYFFQLFDYPIISSSSCHTSSVERFSENFDDKVVTYLIFFLGTHWFRKCNFWKNSLGPFWGRQGRRGQTTSKLKTTKIL